MTRVLRTASDGTLPEPNDRPSSVIWFWSARWPGDHERVGRGVRSAEQDHAGRQRGDERGIRRVDREAIELLAGEHLLGAPRRRTLVAVRIRRGTDDDLAESLARRAHLGIGFEAVLVGLTVQVHDERRHADRLERHAVTAAAVRIQQRVLALLVRGAEARDLRFDGHHFDPRARDGLAVRAGDLAGDDVGGRSNLGAGLGRHAERRHDDGRRQLVVVSCRIRRMRRLSCSHGTYPTTSPGVSTIRDRLRSRSRWSRTTPAAPAATSHAG